MEPLNILIMDKDILAWYNMPILGYKNIAQQWPMTYIGTIECYIHNSFAEIIF